MHRADVAAKSTAESVIGAGDGQAISRGVESDRIAQLTGNGGAGIKILCADIAAADGRLQAAVAEIGIGKTEQIDRARIDGAIAETGVESCAHRKLVGVGIHGDRPAKPVICFQSAHVDVLAPCVALADQSLKLGAVEIAIGEAVQINRAAVAVAGAVASAVVERRADGHAVAGGIHGHTGAETVVQLDATYIDPRFGQVRANRTCITATAEIAVSEGKQMHAFTVTLISDSEPVAVAVHGNHAEFVASLQAAGHVDVLAAAGVANADTAVERGIAETAIAEAEQEDRAGVIRVVGETIVIGHPNSKAVAGCVHGNG